MSNLAPGTYVQESNFPTFTTNAPTDTVAVFVGAHNRGPTGPTLVQSWAQFVSLFGGFTLGEVPSNLALAVYEYFNNGGGQCYVIRVVHSDAIASSAVLDGSSAAPTLGVSAVNAGVWGENIYVLVTPIGTARFSLTVFFGGTGQNNVAEPVWANLSMDPADPRYAPSIINNPLNGSQFIRVTDENAAPSAASEIPVTPAAVQINQTAGSDGSAATSSDLAGTTAQLDQITNPMLINFPGVSDGTNVLEPIISYIESQRAWPDSVLFVDTAPGQTPAAAIAYAGQLPTSSYAAVYYPWVTVSDPASNAPGAVRTVAPCAFVMGRIAQTDATQGVQKAPAGLQTALAALSPERKLLSSDVGNLTAANVNCITFKQGAGTVVWGARTLSNVQSTLYLNVRRVLIYVEANLKALTDFAVFEDNNSLLWQQITMRWDSFLSRFWAGGGLAGNTAADAYFVTCDESINTPNSGTVVGKAGVATSDPAEFVIISVGQWSGGTTVTESVATAAAA